MRSKMIGCVLAPLLGACLLLAGCGDDGGGATASRSTASAPGGTTSAVSVGGCRYVKSDIDYRTLLITGENENTEYFKVAGIDSSGDPEMANALPQETAYGQKILSQAPAGGLKRYIDFVCPAYARQVTAQPTQANRLQLTHSEEIVENGFRPMCTAGSPMNMQVSQQSGTNPLVAAKQIYSNLMPEPYDSLDINSADELAAAKFLCPQFFQ